MENNYGLIGYPLSHSFSEKYFAEKFFKENIENSQYKPYSIENIELFTQLTKDIKNLKGLNVTIPYKEQVIPFLTELDETAKEIGAVNTIKPTANGLKGYNTDAFGFRETLKPMLHPNHERALILGTGGASKAVEYVLKTLGISYYYVSRTADHSKNIIGYEDVSEQLIKSHQLIINTTPLGMSPNLDTYPNIPYEALTEKHLLYDLVYNPEKTMFLKMGELRGSQIINGLQMLYFQAEEAWRIWNS